MPSNNSNNSNNNNGNSRGGANLPNPSSPRTIREGVEYAPSPSYGRPPRPGSGGNSGR